MIVIVWIIYLGTKSLSSLKKYPGNIPIGNLRQIQMTQKIVYSKPRRYFNDKKKSNHFYDMNKTDAFNF